MSNKTTIKIFIASAGEMAEERLRVDNVFVRLNKSHKHLHLEPIKYEYDTIAGNQPEYDRLQDAIMPKLKESALVIFLFFTKLGKYTKEEFEYTIAEKKQLFTFFKQVKKTASYPADDYNELLTFKNSMKDAVLWLDYKNINDFDSLLYEKLNHYLSETHPFGNIESYDRTVSNLSESNRDLIRMLAEKDEQIKELRENDKIIQDNNIAHQIRILLAQQDQIKEQLSKSEEIIQQQTKEKAGLEQQLLLQKEKDKLKAKAFDAVEKGNYDEAEQFLKQSAEESINDTASTFFEIGKLKKIQLKYADALSYFELAAKIDPENNDYLTETGLVANELGYFDKMLHYFKKKLILNQKLYGKEHPNIATSYNYLGDGFNQKGYYDKAILYFEKSISINKKAYNSHHPHIAISYNNLGEVYHNKGLYKLSIKYYQLALKINKKLCIKSQIADNYSNLGVTHERMHEYEKAINYYKKALKIDKEIHGKESSLMALDYNNLGVVHELKGIYEIAIKYQKKALTIGKKVYGEEHPKIAVFYHNLATVLLRVGQNEKALQYYKKGLSIDKKFYGYNHPEIATDYNNLGLLFKKIGEYHKSIQYHKQALTILSQFVEEEHPNMQRVKENLKSAQTALAKQNNPDRK